MERVVRWDTPKAVALETFRGGTRYSEQELKDLAEAGKVRWRGGDGSPIEVGYVYVRDGQKEFYDLDWAEVPPTRIARAEDDPREWPIEPPPPERESGGGGNTPRAGR